MNVLVIGSGGREHALAFRLSQSASVSRLFCAPGNPGTQLLATNLPIAETDTAALVAAVKDLQIHLAVIGPEDPLAAGLADALRAAGVLVFGPGAAGAKLESDKWFAKELMKAQSVPTADARTFTSATAALEFVRHRGAAGEFPLVVKAAGLAKGKGVTVCYRLDHAEDAIARAMTAKEFGAAGSRLVIEDFLVGPEVSVLALTDGKTLMVLDPCQDHKAIDDGDTGPMTGGMGAYCPVPQAIISDEVMTAVERQVFIPIIDGLNREQVPYRGLLYAGLMLTPKGPQVLEFNCRFGDPETQPLMMRFQGDLAATLMAVAEGKLESATPPTFDPRPAMCVVAASKGYPGAYAKGVPITGIEAAESDGDVKVFLSGTRRLGGQLLTDGGRVLGVTALGETLAVAREMAYAGLGKVKFEGMQYRKDIGHQALKLR